MSRATDRRESRIGATFRSSWGAGTVRNPERNGSDAYDVRAGGWRALVVAALFPLRWLAWKTGR